MGRIEVIEYQQVEGEDLYPRAKPPATGILHMNYRIPDLKPIRERLANLTVTEHGTINALYGSGETISLHSPAGFRIEVQG